MVLKDLKVLVVQGRRASRERRETMGQDSKDRKAMKESMVFRAIREFRDL